MKGSHMKTLLLHVDDDEGGKARTKAAFSFAEKHGSHIIASHPIPTLPGYAGYPMHGFSQELGLTFISVEEERAHKIKAQFTGSLPTGQPSWEWVEKDGSPTEVLSLQARTADLTIVGSSPKTEGLVAIYSLAGDIALTSGLPVLAVPQKWEVSLDKKPIVIAWNGSLEASKAVRFAMPLLRAAHEVIVVEVGEENAAHLPATDIANYLARHGLKVEVAKLSVKDTVGSEILSVAHTSNAEMIIMGAYGHRRFKELVFGGVTQELLSNDQIPVFLCH